MSAVLKQGIWTPEKRLEQSRALRGRQIWLKSTGPRTVAGKLKSSMNARKEGYEDRQQEKRVRNYVRLNRLFTSIYLAQRPQWHVLTNAARLAVLRELNVLQNELSLLASKIENGFSESSNIIPFKGAPPP